MRVVRYAEGTWWLQCLRRQHEADLRIYQQAHRVLANRAIHWIMIPVECGCLFWILALMIRRNMFLLLWCVGLLLGGLSLVLARNNALGIACLLFHMGTVQGCIWITQYLEPQASLIGVVTAWTMAWLFQVCIGHWVIEGNQPNVANVESISILAVCQSVLIAWSS